MPPEDEPAEPLAGAVSEFGVVGPEYVIEPAELGLPGAAPI